MSQGLKYPQETVQFSSIESVCPETEVVVDSGNVYEIYSLALSLKSLWAFLSYSYSVVIFFTISWV